MMQLRRTEFEGEKLSTNVKSQTGSTICISRLTKSIIYNIYYERRLLPKEYFTTRIIEGIPMREFIPDTDNRRILKINGWIEELMESIAKKELKHVCLELITLDKNKLIECYNIKYSYRDEETAKKIPEQYTANGIQSMLKNMKNIFQNKLNPLVDKRNLKFRLTADTRGRGKDSALFSAGKRRVMEFQVEDDKVDMEIGTVCTPYHRLILRVIAEVKENTDNETENDVIIVEENSEEYPEPEIIDLDDYPDTDIATTPANGSPNQAENVETESSKLYSTILEMSNLKVTCICDTQVRDNIFTIIQCKNCSTYQHAECYGIHKIAKIPARHLCHNCACLLSDTFLKVRSPATGQIISQENNSYTDPRLVEYTNAELKEIGRIRLVLMYIYREKQVPLHFMRDNFEADFENAAEKMVKFGILTQNDDRFQINPSKINIFIRKHFKPRYSINKYF